MLVKELNLLFKTKKLVFNEYHRVKTNTTPLYLSQPNSLNNDELNIIRKASNVFNRHPLWVVFEKESDSVITIKWLNETTKKVNDRHLLLGKQDIPETNCQYVRQGFTITYNLENFKEKTNFFSFVNSFTEFYPAHNKKLPENISLHCHFQDVREFYNKPSLLQTLDIQMSQLESLTDNLRTNLDIVEGHSSLTNYKNIYKDKTHYIWTQEQHRKLSENSNLSPFEQSQHIEIVKRMEFAKSLSSFVSKFYK